MRLPSPLAGAQLVDMYVEHTESDLRICDVLVVCWLFSFERHVSASFGAAGGLVPDDLEVLCQEF